MSLENLLKTPEPVGQKNAKNIGRLSSLDQIISRPASRLLSIGNNRFQKSSLSIVK
jgi:hypothetical protein